MADQYTFDLMGLVSQRNSHFRIDLHYGCNNSWQRVVVVFQIKQELCGWDERCDSDTDRHRHSWLFAQN